VATLGTALTERQAKLLVRYTESKRVMLCFDADTAGVRAVDRGTQTINHIAEGVGIELRVIAVPGGKDPDECLRGSGEHEGVEAFAGAVKKAPLFIDYQLEKTIAGVDIKTHSGRIEAARLVVPILAEIKNAVARGEYVRQWSLRLSLREEELLSDVGQLRRTQKLGVQAPRIDEKVRQRAAQKNAPRSGYVEAERQLLALFLMSKEDHQAASDSLGDEKFIDPAHRRIREAIEGVGQFTSAEDFQYRLMDRLGPDPQASAALVDIILKLEEQEKQNLPREVILKDNKARILQEKLNQGKNKLRAGLLLADSDEEQAELQSKIMSLQLLEVQALRGAQTDDQMTEIRRQIDSLLPETIK
jgi:DNA primase